MVLRLLREAGGASTIAALKVAANARGITRFDEHLGELMASALVLYTEAARVRHELWNRRSNSYSGWIQDPEYRIEIVEAASALADDSIELPPSAEAVELYAAEPYGIEERSPAALLHAVWSVVRWASERDLTLTKTTGALRKADVKALDNQLKEAVELRDFAFVLALGSGLLEVRRERVVAHRNASQLFEMPPREQIARLLKTWLALENWSEFFRIPEIETENHIVPRAQADPEIWGAPRSDVPTAQSLVEARAYLLGILQGADAKSLGQWQSLASLLRLVRARNPEFLIPLVTQRPRYGSRARDGQYQGFWPRGESRWDAAFGRETDWDLVEGRYLHQVLAEPLSWLGLVAIARDQSGAVAAFRLSPLGAHLLGLSDEAPVSEAPAGADKPLIVQPNFEIIAYTDAQHLRTLYQLERFATRERAERVAHYKLDRESVYRGFQDGLSAAEMREFLELHSRSGVPQNIAYSLDDWQMLWERVTVRPAASVIEAGSAAEMDAFLAALPDSAATRLAPKWAAIEARYLEAARVIMAATPNARAFDYSIAIEQAFETTADLEILVPQANFDLWLGSKLEQFADAQPDETQPDDKWRAENEKVRFRITRESVERAAKLGVTADETLAFLAQTGTPPLPANVALTVRGWGGAVEPLGLGALQVLSAAPGVIAQMASIGELRPLLWLGAGESVALVKTADVPKLRAALQARGIALDGTPATHLSAPRPLATPKTPPRQRPASRGVEVASGIGAKVKPVVVAAHPDEGDLPLQSGLEPSAIKKLLKNAISTSRCVVIQYQSKALHALRKIAPLEVYSEGGNTYLSAWDYWRDDGRIFRVDRVTRIAVLDEEFDAGQFE